jgi:hypothetical protein
MRLIVVLIGLLLLGSAADAIDCQSSRPANKSHWAWRLIDNKKCWYAGEPGMEKSKLRWPVHLDRSPDLPRASRAAAPSLSPTVETTRPAAPSSREAHLWSTFGMGLAVPASDIDWDARWPSRESPALQVSEVESNAVARAPVPPLSPWLVGMLIFALLTLCTLAIWSFWFANSHRMRSRFAGRRMVHTPPSATPLQPAQPYRARRSVSEYLSPPTHAPRPDRHNRASTAY